MKKHTGYVGIISPIFLSWTSLKKEALLFEKIAIPNISEEDVFISKHRNCPIRSIEYLIENDIIIDPIKEHLGEKLYLERTKYDHFNKWRDKIDSKSASASKLLEDPDFVEFKSKNSILCGLFKIQNPSTKKKTLEFENDLVNIFKHMGVGLLEGLTKLNYDLREMSGDLYNKHGIISCPVYPYIAAQNIKFISGKDDVIRVILNNLPEPDFESTSWEQIIDFRDDPESKKLLVYLRHWINKASKGDHTFQELNDEIEYYQQKYIEHLSFHKMKINTGSLETLISIPAEMLEGILKMKPTKTVKALFFLKHRKLELLEQEKDAPGRDLAYIIKASEAFDD